ncbi:MAG: two-component regulator propeller domain-containing protein, partial [Cyclobacteriaceae bacterium]
MSSNNQLHIVVKYCLGMLLLFQIVSTKAQNQFNYFRHISTAEGFSLNSVNSIGQDENGLIWFGTRNGLLRYDGINLKVVRREKYPLEQLGANDIYVISVDSTKGVWIGSKYGLSLHDDKTDTSKYLRRVSRRVFDILRTNSNDVWLATAQGIELLQTYEDTIIVDQFPLGKDLKEKLGMVLSLHASTRDKSIWAGTNNGIWNLTKQQNGQYETEHFNLSSSDENYRVNAIIEDHSGNLWVGTDHGLFLKKNGDASFASFKSISNDLLTNDLVRCLTVDTQNRLWVGTYDGLNIIDNLTITHKIRHDPQNPDGITDNNIRSLFSDENGGVWIGTYFGGVNYWSGKLMSFSKIDERSGTQLGYNVVNKIIQDEDSRIYFGTEGSGINVYDPASNKFTKIDAPFFDPDLGALKVKELFYEGNGRFWIGTFEQGLLHYDGNSGQLKGYTNKSFDANSLSSDRVISIDQAPDGNLWIGTLNTGLDLFDPKKEQFTHFGASDKNPAITYNNVRSLLVTEAGDLYVGTGSGLSFLPADAYKNRTFNFQFFTKTDGTSDNLTILDIIEDRHSKIWIATLHSGLYYLREGKLESVELAGISSVFAIVEAKEGVLWLSTEEGVVKYDPSNKEQQIFNRKDGVYPNEFNRGAKLRSDNGEIYFGGASGVTVFHPNSFGVRNDHAPKVVITSFELSGEPLTPNDSSGILTKSIEYTRELTLDYDQNIFSIYYAMPNYINPGKNVYSYRLVGLNDSWIKTTNPFVSFTIQRGGSYVFEVKGINSDGVETEEITSLEINVNDPLWLTNWAYLLYFLIVLSITAVLIYFSKSRLQLQHQLDLETREFIQQQELNQQKLQFFTNISHEFRTPLTLISGPLEKLIEDYTGPRKFFRQLLVIKKSTDQLFKLINELMDFRKLENKQMKLQAAEGNIVKFAKEVFLSFDQQAKINKTAYTFHSEHAELRVYYDRDKLEKVLYNLISNAFKYTPAHGEISVHLSQINGIVKVIVTDNGEGISKDHAERIFDRYYEIPKKKLAGKYKQGSGIGLAIAKNLMDLHKGELSVSSEEGKGSSFIMTFRQGREHLDDTDIISEFRDSEDVAQYIPPSSEENNPLDDLELQSDVQDEEQPKILVVEDNHDISRFMHSILKPYYHVLISENGSDGFQKALAEQPDLIISDVMMPVMNGIDFCAKIKTDIRTSHIPFILLTARTSLVFKYDGLESGADDYLNKPFQIKELLLKCKN